MTEQKEVTKPRICAESTADVAWTETMKSRMGLQFPGTGANEGGAIIGLTVAARCGADAGMTKTGFMEAARIVWNWELKRRRRKVLTK